MLVLYVAQILIPTVYSIKIEFVSYILLLQ
jgi:hypothetical protein